jgi:tetratricopeptide (TPR) repeat protein
MKKGILLLLTILTLGVKSFAQSQESGIKQMIKENYQTAAGIFKKIIADKPGDADNYYYLGQCYLELNKQDSAKQIFVQGIQADSKSILPYVGIGEWYLNQNDVANAKQSFDKAIDNSPSKNAKTLVAIAQAYTNSEHSNYEEAIDLLNKAQLIDSKDGSVYEALGDVYFVENNGGPAVDNYDRAIQLDKDVAECDTREGVIWRQALQYDQSLPKFQDALKNDSSFAPAYRGLAELYYITRQYQRAKDTYTKYLALADKNDYTKYRYAEFLFLSNDFQNTIIQLKDLATRDTTTATLYRLLGYSYYRTSDYPDGITAMQKFFKKVKADKIIDSDYIYYGRLLYKNNMDSQAIIVYHKAITIDSTDCSLRGELANMLYKDKKYDVAAGAWQNDINCLKDKAGLNEYFQLGLSYFFSNQFGKADTTFKNAEKFNSTWIQLPLFRARCQAHIDTGMTLGTAKALYDTVLVLALKDSVHNKPAITEAYLYDGYYVLQINKDFKQSVDYFNRVLSIDPDNAAAKDAIDKINEAIKESKTPQRAPAPKQNSSH